MTTDTTTTDITTPTPLTSDYLTNLDPNTAGPCADCGVATTVALRWVEATIPPITRHAPSLGTYTVATACAECAPRHRLADAIVDKFPSLQGKYGTIAGAKLAAALLVLQDRGKPLPDLDHLELAAVVHLVERLALAGSGLRFVTSEGRPGRAARYPWAHLDATPDARSAALEAWLHHWADLQATARPDIALSPPERPEPSKSLAIADACLLCGVGAVLLPAAEVSRRGGAASAALDVWPRTLSVTSHGLGGPRLGQPVHGPLCRDCCAAADQLGHVGPELRARLSAARLTELGRPEDAELVRLGDAVPAPAYGGLVARAHRQGSPRPAPNPPTAPWGHWGPTDPDRQTVVADSDGEG